MFSSYASVMPQWIRATFFGPEMERNRIGIHNYQEYKLIKQLRKMKDCRLIDELEIPLKSLENFCQPASHAVNQGLGRYLDTFICPQPGDWPA